MDLRDYFTKNLPPKQRQYEAIRAVAFNESAIKDIAERFGYTAQTLRMLINRLVRDKLQLFPDIKRGPKGRHIPSETEKVIIQLRRKKMLNSREITEQLNRSNISIGAVSYTHLASGEHMLYLVTANDLGRILVEHRFSQDLKRHN